MKFDHSLLNFVSGKNHRKIDVLNFHRGGAVAKSVGVQVGGTLCSFILFFHGKVYKIH